LKTRIVLHYEQANRMTEHLRFRLQLDGQTSGDCPYANSRAILLASL
jgi:hypothetical protein